MLSSLALAVAPGAAIAVLVYSRDKYDREPLKPLLISFLLGAIATLPAIRIQTFLRPVLYKYYPGYTPLYYFLLAFLIVAISEEGVKYLALRFYAYRHKEFNEPFDGIIYSVMVGMGFATLENIGYVVNYGFATGILRMFLSVPSHGAFAVIMGYHIGLAKFKHQPGHIWVMAKGFLLAVFFHGAFDYCLLMQDCTQIKNYISNYYLLGGALLTYAIAISLAVKSIRLHEAISKRQFAEKDQPAVDL